MRNATYIELLAADMQAGIELARDPRMPDPDDPLRYFKLVILNREGVISKRTLLEQLGTIEVSPA